MKERKEEWKKRKKEKNPHAAVHHPFFPPSPAHAFVHAPRPSGKGPPTFRFVSQIFPIGFHHGFVGSKAGRLSGGKSRECGKGKSSVFFLLDGYSHWYFFSSSMMILLLSCVIYAVVLAPCFSRSFLSQLSLPLYNTLLYSLYTLLLSVSLSLVLSLPLFLSSLFSQLASFFSVFSLSLVSISPFPIYFPVLELLQSILSHLHLHFRPSYFSLKVQYLRTFRSSCVLLRSCYAHSSSNDPQIASSSHSKVSLCVWSVQKRYLTVFVYFQVCDSVLTARRLLKCDSARGMSCREGMFGMCVLLFFFCWFLCRPIAALGCLTLSLTDPV